MPLYDYEDEVDGGQGQRTTRRRSVLGWLFYKIRQYLILLFWFSVLILPWFLINDARWWIGLFGAPPPDWLLIGFQWVISALGRLAQLGYQAVEWLIQRVF